MRQTLRLSLPHHAREDCYRLSSSPELSNTALPSQDSPPGATPDMIQNKTAYDLRVTAYLLTPHFNLLNVFYTNRTNPCFGLRQRWSFQSQASFPGQPPASMTFVQPTYQEVFNPEATYSQQSPPEALTHSPPVLTLPGQALLRSDAHPSSIPPQQ